MLTDEERAFLDKYEALCREAGYTIEACGCCGSPWVAKLGVKHGRSLDEHMAHLRDG